MIKRLVVIVFIFIIIDFLFLFYHFVFPFTSHRSEIKEWDWVDRFGKFAVLQFIYYVSRPLFLFGLTYFFCTPKDLFKDYKKIIVAIIGAGYLGKIAGLALGLVLTSFDSWIQLIGREEFLKFVREELGSRPKLFLSPSLATLFMTFTASTLSYIRRGIHPSTQDVGKVRVRLGMYKRLAIIVLAFSLVGFFIHVYAQYLTLVFPLSFEMEFEAWKRKEWVISTLRSVYSYVGLVLFFFLIYYLCTPKDLFKEYRKIIFVILISDLGGGMLGSTLGILIIRSLGHAQLIWQVDYIKAIIMPMLFNWMISPLGSLFKVFTACTLSYIRRRSVWKGEMQNDLPKTCTKLEHLLIGLVRLFRYISAIIAG